MDDVRARIKARREAQKEGYAPGDIDRPVGAVTPIPQSDKDAARERILAKTRAMRGKGGMQNKHRRR